MSLESSYADIGQPTAVLNKAPIWMEILPLTLDDETSVKNLIKVSLISYKDHNSVLSSTFKRLDHLYKNYQKPYHQFFVAKNLTDGQCIGSIGIGLFKGLPISEELGEIRDLTVLPKFQGQGIAKKLLNTALHTAKQLGYKKIYLETTPQMKKAQQLFLSSGFRPISQDGEEAHSTDLPTYLFNNNF